MDKLPATLLHHVANFLPLGDKITLGRCSRYIKLQIQLHPFTLTDRYYRAEELKDTSVNIVSLHLMWSTFLLGETGDAIYSKLTKLSFITPNQDVVDLAFLSKCTNLRQLIVGGNITSVPPLPQLTIFRLNTSPTFEHSQSLTTCTNLSKLVLTGCGITSLDDLVGLPHLTKVKLISCHKLGHLPEFTGCPKLVSLSVKVCEELSHFDDVALEVNLVKFKAIRCSKLRCLNALRYSKLVQFMYQGCQSFDPALLGTCPLLETVTLHFAMEELELSSLLACPNITGLYLDVPYITDIEALGRFPKLTDIALSTSNCYLPYLASIKTVFLAEMHKISNLDFVSPNLISLVVISNQLTDIAALERCPNLTRLNLTYTGQNFAHHWDKLPLSLQELKLTVMDLHSLTARPMLCQLVELHLIETQLTNLEGLEHCSALTILVLKKNFLLQEVTTLTKLQKLITLTIDTAPLLLELKLPSSIVDLNLYSCSQLGFISPLSDCPNLSVVSLSDLKFENLAFLAHSTVTTVNLRDNFVLEDLGDLSTCANLVEIYAPQCPALVSLPTCPSLRRLDLAYCVKLVDLTPIATATLLEKISLTGCTSIVSLEPLSALRYLTMLDISGCQDIEVPPDIIAKLWQRRRIHYVTEVEL